MQKEKIKVPSGIRYISEWNEFNFSKFPGKCIINKQLPGCGFTEYCIRSNENVKTKYNNVRITTKYTK